MLRIEPPPAQTHACGSDSQNGSISTVTVDTEAGHRETTAAERQSSGVGSSCLDMMRSPTSGVGGSRSSWEHGVVGVCKITDHVRVTNVADRGPGELTRTARSCTNATNNSTTSERINSVPLHCTWIERRITLPTLGIYNMCTSKEQK